MVFWLLSVTPYFLLLFVVGLCECLATQLSLLFNADSFLGPLPSPLLSNGVFCRSSCICDRVSTSLLCTFICSMHHSCCVCLVHVWHVRGRRSIPAVQKGEPSIPMRWTHLLLFPFILFILSFFLFSSVWCNLPLSLSSSSVSLYFPAFLLASILTLFSRNMRVGCSSVRLSCGCGGV